MNKNIYFFLFLAFGFFSVSCARLSGVPADLKGERAENYEEKKSDFTYLSARSKIRYKDQNREVKAVANIRIRKDSLIWISVRSSGIEGVRVIFTTDSVFIIDRMEKTYLARNFENISNDLGFKASYEIIQSTLLGEIPFDAGEEGKMQKRRNTFVREYNFQNYEMVNRISRYILKPVSFSMKENGSSNRLAIEYENFRKLDEQIFPFLIHADVFYLSDGAELNTDIEIEHTKIELHTEELSFPFKVPADYR